MFTRSFDIDDTITAAPEHFAKLSKETYAQGGRVVIITSRLDEPGIRASTHPMVRSVRTSWVEAKLFGDYF